MLNNNIDAHKIFYFTKLVFVERYMGSTLGWLWAVIGPIIMLLLFTFVFGVVFRAKIPGAESTLGYAIWLIAGYGPWLAFAESLSGGCTSIVGNTTLVKNVPFRLEVLPAASTLAGHLPIVICTVFLIGLILIDQGRVPWTLGLLPVVVGIQLLFLYGLSLLLGAVTVFIRDVAHVMTSITLFLMFFTPIFYSVDMVPEPLRLLVNLNPFHAIVSMYRDILVFGVIPDLWALGYSVAIAGVMFLVGQTVFSRLRPYFDGMM